MKITVEGARCAPLFESTQEVIRVCLRRDGKLTRISKRGNQFNYSALGVYDLTFVTDDGESIECVLEAK
jgi:hypothetical protein